MGSRCIDKNWNKKPRIYNTHDDDGGGDYKNGLLDDSIHCRFKYPETFESESYWRATRDKNYRAAKWV